MWNDDLSRIAFGVFLTLFTFVVPLVVAALPLLIVIRLAKLQQVRGSVWLLAASTVVGTGVGFLTSGLAVLICGNALAYGMPGDGAKCVTGAAIFLPIGILFTILAFLMGLYLTGAVVVKMVNESAREDWY